MSVVAQHYLQRLSQYFTWISVSGHKVFRLKLDLAYAARLKEEKVINKPSGAVLENEVVKLYKEVLQVNVQGI